MPFGLLSQSVPYHGVEGNALIFGGERGAQVYGSFMTKAGK